MNQKELEELMEKAKAATPGPWATDGGMNLYVLAADDGMVARMRGTGFGRTDLEQGNNAKLIAAANPQVVLDLCERVIGLQEALKQYADRSAFKYNRLTRGEVNFDAGATAEVAEQALERFGVKNKVEE